MPPDTLAQRLLELLEADEPRPVRRALDNADEAVVARPQQAVDARDGSDPSRLVDDHVRLHLDGAMSAASERALALALASYAGERDRIRRAATGRFVHDLRNALGAITLTAQRWLRVAPGGNPRDDAALLLRQAAQVGDLLDAMGRREDSAPDAAALLAPGSASLASECRASLDELRAAHPGLAIAFEAGPPALLRCDAFRLREALAHLVTRFALRGATTLAVRVWCQPRTTAGLTVEIAGAGAEPAPQRRWQERLAWLVVRQTARAHGGDLRDEGRAATLWLPADAA